MFVWWLSASQQWYLTCVILFLMCGPWGWKVRLYGAVQQGPRGSSEPTCFRDCFFSGCFSAAYWTNRTFFVLLPSVSLSCLFVLSLFLTQPLHHHAQQPLLLFWWSNVYQKHTYTLRTVIHAQAGGRFHCVTGWSGGEDSSALAHRPRHQHSALLWHPSASITAPDRGGSLRVCRPTSGMLCSAEADGRSPESFVVWFDKIWCVHLCVCPVS